MPTDIDILRRAKHYEGDGKDRPRRSWAAYQVGATQSDINRLRAEELIVQVAQSCRIGPHDYGAARYHLTEKADKLVFAANMEKEFRKIPVEETLQAMNRIVGFDDLKLEIARALEKRKRHHFLLEGPPACAKSELLEAIRVAAPDAYMAFGSRTSSAGLSSILFEFQPGILLLDEADKMRHECYSVLLGLMQRGEIIETKIANTRGIILETIVIAACNSSVKMPREFISRFAMHVHFSEYTRDEFIDIVSGVLSQSEEPLPPDVAALIGELTYDLSPLKGGLKVWDIRNALKIAERMMEPTEAEVRRLVNLSLKYGPKEDRRNGHRDLNAAQRRMV